MIEKTTSAAEPSMSGAAAKAISDKKLAAGEKLAAMIKSRKGQLNSGIDPEMMLNVAEVGAQSIAEGVVKFAEWVRDVIVTTLAVGISDDYVTPFLKEAYGAIAANPEKYSVSDYLADSMDSLKDIRKTDIAAILNEISEGTTDKATTSWVNQIKAEYQQLAEDENHLHNQMLHKQILQNWREDSRQMVKTLELAGILDQTAFVMQVRIPTHGDHPITFMPIT
jgi:hypothetical protein